MIKLGYLDGYNALNVPKFADEETRDRQFDENYVRYSIDAYYPPYYTNVIKLDTNEVPQSTPINFVILVHNEKYYYYFVDKFRYINEEIYEIVINMDTALTHMYDYKITNALITRKSINRWNGTEINRDYVRENVSEGIMEVSSFEYRNPNKYVILCSSKNYADISSIAGHYIQNGTTYDFGYHVYLFPLPPFELSSGATIHMYVNGTLMQNVYPHDIVIQFISDPYTLNMMVVESEYLDKIYGTTWTEITPYNECNLQFTGDINALDIVEINSVKWCGFNIRSLNIDNNLVFTDDLGFSKNVSPAAHFNWHYIPQLLDENYMQIEYGDINGFVSYPLHQSKTNTFNYYNNLDVTNGNDGYYILDNLSTTNKHKTYSISLGLTFDLITDPWKEYQALNKGTLSTGIQLQVVNTLYGTAKNIAMPTANRLFNQTRSLQYFEQGKEGLSDMYANQSFRNQQQQLTGLTDGLMQGINILANYQINRENLEYAPDTVKGRANLYSMLFSKYKSPYLKKFLVNDIENCAKKLEEYGYRVNEVYVGESYIQNLCNNRFYYNCISVRVQTYKTLCFIPNEIINNINERLENGLRFINMSSLDEDQPISDIFRFDNVEV